MAQGFLNSIDPLHPVSNLFRSEQGVYMFSCQNCRVSICFLVKIVGCLYVFMLKL